MRSRLIMGLLLSLAAAWEMPVAADPGIPVPVMALQGTRLDIVAEGTVTRVPDIATVDAGVVTQATGAAAALAANARRMAATISALKAAGVADRDIRTAQLSLSPQYRYADNQPPVVTGYQASNSVTVRFRDIARAGPILDALVAAGANQINGPSLEIEHPEAALDEARTQAMATARARAQLYAKAAALSVRRILSISEGDSSQPSVRPMMMTMMASRAKVDTEIQPGEQKLSVSVSVSFELQ